MHLRKEYLDFCSLCAFLKISSLTRQLTYHLCSGCAIGLSLPDVNIEERWLTTKVTMQEKIDVGIKLLFYKSTAHNG